MDSQNSALPASNFSRANATLGVTEALPLITRFKVLRWQPSFGLCSIRVSGAGLRPTSEPVHPVAPGGTRARRYCARLAGLFGHVHHAGAMHGNGSGAGVVGGKYFAECYISKWRGSLSTVH